MRTLQQVLENVEGQREVLVDARAAARFQATAPEPRPGMRGGHIPHSKNVPYDSLLSNGRYDPCFWVQGCDRKAQSISPLTCSCPRANAHAIV